jgi:hypothetical protein
MDFVRTDILEEHISSIIRVKESATTLAVTSSPILITLMMEARRSSETSVLTRATRQHSLQRRWNSVFASQYRIMSYMGDHKWAVVMLAAIIFW